PSRSMRLNSLRALARDSPFSPKASATAAGSAGAAPCSTVPVRPLSSPRSWVTVADTSILPTDRSRTPPLGSVGVGAAAPLHDAPGRQPVGLVVGQLGPVDPAGSPHG